MAPSLLGGCATTLRSKYMDASDPCSSAREPIVKAGDDLDAREKQLADQQADTEMQGQKLPETQRSAYGTQIDFGNMLTNAFHKAVLSQQAYLGMKQKDTGADAATLLASVQGDASSDRARLQSVTHAMRALRECRATQIAAADAGSGGDPAAKLDKLHLQQAKLDEDDQLITKVFGDYGKRAQLYADATTQVLSTPDSSGAGTPRVRKATAKPAAHSSVAALQTEQASAQTADRKQSETLHETLQNSMAGA